MFVLRMSPLVLHSKKFAKIFTVLFLALLFFDVIRVRYLIIVKSGPIVRKSEGYEQVGAVNGPRVLVLGDSSAVGTGASSPEKSVAGLLGQEFPKAYIENRAKNGLRSAGFNKSFKAEPGAFDLIIMHIGGNDELRFTPLTWLRKDIDEILGKAKQTAPHVVFISTGNIGLAPFFPWWAGWVWSARTRQARALFMEESQKHGVVYVDLYTERADDPFAEDPGRYYAPDYLHLSDHGYAVWYQKIREAMERAGIIPVVLQQNTRCVMPLHGGAYCAPREV